MTNVLQQTNQVQENSSQPDDTTTNASSASSGGDNHFSILLVEDSRPQALKLKMILENNDCQVYWADTGQGGLAQVEKQLFNLIILDIELPDITGFEVCRRLKANPEWVDIPVIMLTTHDRADEVANGLDAGAIDYIPKDFFAEAVLLETVKRMQQEC